MSKKLIAVASAAALALSALVGVAPASANTFVVEVQNTSGNSPAQADAVPTITTPTGITAATAYNVNVPSTNVLRSSATSATTTTAALFIVTTTTDRGQVDVTATGGVRLLTAEQLASSLTTVATGTTSLTDFSSSSKFEFYAFNTSTTAGTVVISNAGNSKTIYLAGESDSAYKLAMTSSSTAALGGKIVISGTVKDAFGNDLTLPLPETAFTIALVGATAGFTDAFGTGINEFEYEAATKTYSWAFTAPTTASPVAIQIKATDAIAAVTAFGATAPSAFFTVNAVDLAAQVTALTAQVAALQVIVDRKVKKKRFNTLARKWNAAFPSQAVKLKK
jgi:hypothetical protein